MLFRTRLCRDDPRPPLLWAAVRCDAMRCVREYRVITGGGRRARVHARPLLLGHAGVLAVGLLVHAGVACAAGQAWNNKNTFHIKH